MTRWKGNPISSVYWEWVTVPTRLTGCGPSPRKTSQKEMGSSCAVRHRRHVQSSGVTGGEALPCSSSVRFQGVRKWLERPWAVLAEGRRWTGYILKLPFWTMTGFLKSGPI